MKKNAAGSLGIVIQKDRPETPVLDGPCRLPAVKR
jgi:hypothetical protein